MVSVSVDIYVIDSCKSSQDRDGNSRIFLFDALVVFGEGPGAHIPEEPKRKERCQPLSPYKSASLPGQLWVASSERLCWQKLKLD